MEVINRLITAVVISSLLVAHGYTLEDVNLLATIMYAENGSTGKTKEENRQVLILTGAVVINRTKQDGWGGDTIKAVLYSPGQYAQSTKDSIGKVKVPSYIYELSKRILAFGTNVPSYVVYQSTQKNLGYAWKNLAGEYFACAEKGHLNEGDDFIAEVFSIDSYIDWNTINILGNTDNRGFIGTSMDFIWGNVHSAIVGGLDMAD